jgi:CBS domain-containing protein
MTMFDTTTLTAADVMTRDVVTVGPHTTLRDAAKLMEKRHVSALPVVDAAGAILGLVSDTDLLRLDPAAERKRDWWLAMLADGHDLAPEFLAAIRDTGRLVSQVMHPEVVSVAETAPLAEVARLIAGKQVRRVLVLRGSKLAGVVSRADLIRALAREAG